MTEDFRWDVAAAGLLCLDLTPEIPPKGSQDLSILLAPGKLLNVGPAAFSTGGAVSNTGIVLKKLGMKVLFMSQVGDDGFGEITVRLLQKYGETGGVKVTSRMGSSYSIILAFPGIDRMILHYPGCNDTFSSESLDYGLVAGCRAFHFGYPPLMRALFRGAGRELAAVFRRVRGLGVVTSLDTSLPDPDSESGRVPWRDVLASVLPYVDIFTPSLEEALYFLDPERTLRRKRDHPSFTDSLSFADHRSIARDFLAMGCGAVLLKCGARGLYLRTGGLSSSGTLEARTPARAGSWDHREIWAPPFAIETILSATGAGDTSIGGFLAAMLRGLDPEDAARLASCAGRQNLTALDATSGVGGWDAVLKDAEELPVAELPWEKADARWDERSRIWIGAEDGLTSVRREGG